MRTLLITMMIGLMITVSSGVCECGVNSERIPESVDTAILMVGQRRSLLTYLRNEDINRYRALIDRLGLRK